MFSQMDNLRMESRPIGVKIEDVSYIDSAFNLQSLEFSMENPHGQFHSFNSGPLKVKAYML